MDYPKLLIVDDDEEICRQMHWALTGYKVFLAHDRACALHVFKAEQPAVVGLDLGLPRTRETWTKDSGP